MPGTVPKNGRWSDETSIGPPHARVDLRRPRARAAAGAARARRARPSAASVGEALVDLAAEPDRAGAAAHQHAAVVRRAEVVQEHAAVDDRLAAGPADLLEQLRHRLGQHDVAAEDGHAGGASGLQPAAAALTRDDDLPGARPAPAPSSTTPSRDVVTRECSCSSRAARDRPAQCPHEPGRLHGRAVAEEDALAEDAASGCACASSSAVRSTASSGTPSSRAASTSSLDRLVLRRRGRDPQHPALAQPDIRPRARRRRARPGRCAPRRARDREARRRRRSVRAAAADGSSSRGTKPPLRPLGPRRTRRPRARRRASPGSRSFNASAVHSPV